MADSAVAITAGTGTSIDTRTEATNGNHRQVVVIGDPSTNAGVAPVDATNGLSVTLTTALPAGTAAIGKLAANSGVDIGDVDVTSIAAGDNNIGNVDIVTINSVAPAFGSGVRGATVQRVTIATDDVVPVTDNGGNLSIDDGGNSITVDYATTGSGTATGALRVELPTNGTGVIATVGAVTAITNALPAGTNAIGKLAANSGVDIGDVDVTSMPGTGVEDAAETAGGTLLMAGTVRRDTAASSAGTTGDNATLNTDATGRLWTTTTVVEDVAHSAGEAISGNGVRRIDTAASSAGTSGDWATMDASAEGGLWVTTTPTTTSGCTIFRSIDLDETEEDIKTSAGNLYGYYFFNSAATTHYLKFYNATAANTTVGTTTPVLTFPLPAGAAGHISFGFPVSFGTAICAAVTTGLADNDTGAPAASAVILNAFYK